MVKLLAATYAWLIQLLLKHPPILFHVRVLIAAKCQAYVVLKVDYLIICIICDTDSVNKLTLQMYTLHKYK